MFDRFMYKILGSIDDFFNRIENWFTAPRCQCKLKKKGLYNNGLRRKNKKDN